MCCAVDTGWESVMEQAEWGVGQAQSGPAQRATGCDRSRGRSSRASAGGGAGLVPGPPGLSQTHLRPRRASHRHMAAAVHARTGSELLNRLPSSREEPMVAHVDIDIAQVWRDYKEYSSVELRNQLVEHYLPRVKDTAERIWARLPDGVDLDDLISAGIFGLMDAIEAFDLNRGVKFETYCVPRIRGAMLDELRTMDWVPRLVRSKASKMEEA